MCIFRFQVLLYAHSCGIKWIDCSTNSPKGQNVECLIEHEVTEMTTIIDKGNNEAVVTLDGTGGLFTYDIKSSSLLWKIEEILPGLHYKINAAKVTTDDQSNVYVIDLWNPGIQMFSADGTYRGFALKYDEYDFDAVYNISWAQRGKFSSSCVQKEKRAQNSNFKISARTVTAPV